MRCICGAFAHGSKIVVLVNLTPVHAPLERSFEHEVEPDVCAAPIALHKGVGDVHLHILVDNFIKGGFRHSFDGAERSREVHTVGKDEAALTDVLRAYLPCKVVKSAEEVGVYLLQTLHAARLKTLQQPALEKLVCLLRLCPSMVLSL